MKKVPSVLIIILLILGLFSCNQKTSIHETDTDAAEIKTIDDFYLNYDLKVSVSFQPSGTGYIMNVFGDKLYYVTTDPYTENVIDDLTEQHTFSEDEMMILKDYYNYLHSGYDLKEVNGTDGITINIWFDDECKYLRFGSQNDTIDEMILFLCSFLPEEVSHIDFMK